LPIPLQDVYGVEEWNLPVINNMLKIPALTGRDLDVPDEKGKGKAKKKKAKN
jgi:hypothetical protein